MFYLLVFFVFVKLILIKKNVKFVNKELLGSGYPVLTD